MMLNITRVRAIQWPSPPIESKPRIYTTPLTRTTYQIIQGNQNHMGRGCPLPAPSSPCRMGRGWWVCPFGIHPQTLGSVPPVPVPGGTTGPSAPHPPLHHPPTAVGEKNHKFTTKYKSPNQNTNTHSTTKTP